MLDRMVRGTERLTRWFAIIGGIIILIQMSWISYGVFTRYVLGDPDAYVTEATALLLFPVAFLGLAYALSVNAYPTVSYVVDTLQGKAKRALVAFNLLIMVLIGAFFSYAGIDATIKAYSSGAASEILLWPRFYFWLPGAIALVLFTWYAMLRLAQVCLDRKDLAAGSEIEPGQAK
ncbi:TRAP transporter small permease [Orrella daihaiensis]|uniref:TRAP transporter small permease protein n=1 Tax=Orrella daihaiensis TaxID=2782176 RepID=A0ABY4AHD6_9BURK|nr:TRAP transporter small permease [Orrella daihaiensis]UOD49493.1 TRAP transporter small permease [Orrella daihaiensis]